MTVSDQLTGIDPAGYDYSGHDLTESEGSGNDTIAASATAMSDAGIGIIRVSGRGRDLCRHLHERKRHARP